MSFSAELLSLMGLMFLALISPGPDTIMVLRQFLKFGKRTAIYTSIGVGLGILVHIAYSLLGIGLIISQSIIIFNIMKIAGGLYLLYIGLMTFKSRFEPEISEDKSIKKQSPLRAIWIGFLTNSLNPKATIFFLSIFTVVINPGTPLNNQLIYGFVMSLETMLWYVLLSFFLSVLKINKTVSWFGKIGNKLIGGLLMLLGVKLALSN